MSGDRPRLDGADRPQPADNDGGPGIDTVSGHAPAFVPVTVVSGFDRVTGLLLRGDRLAAVYGDLSGAEQGYVTITVNDSDGLSGNRRVELDNHCASCPQLAPLRAPSSLRCSLATLRAATIAALTHLATHGDYDTLLLQLHPGVEPDAALRGLATGLPPALRMDSHVTVLPADWLDILSGSSTLTERGAGTTADDDRFAATVLCAGIETASTIVLPTDRHLHDRRLHGNHLNGSPGQISNRANEERAVLDLLAPAAVRLRLRSVLDVHARDVIATARLDCDRLDPLAAYGIRDPTRFLSPAGSLTLVRWHASRPLHPLRLHAALDQLADGVIRSSGRLDVADQPDSVVGWDSAGESLELGPIAPCRELPATRCSSLAFLGDDLDTAHIHAVLDACLLTDDELAILTCSWDDFAQDSRAGDRRSSNYGDHTA